MNKLDRIKLKIHRLQNKIVKYEIKYDEILSAYDLRVVDERYLAVKETVAKVYELMTTEFEPYVDKDIVKEIVSRFGVEVD